MSLNSQPVQMEHAEQQLELALCRQNMLHTVIKTLGFSCHQQQCTSVHVVSAMRAHSSSANVQACFPKQMLSAQIYSQHPATGRSLVYKLKRLRASTELCRRLFLDPPELNILAMVHPKTSSLQKQFCQAYEPVRHVLLSFSNRPMCYTVSYAVVRSKNTVPVLSCTWKPCLVHVVRTVTQSQVLHFFYKVRPDLG